MSSAPPRSNQAHDRKAMSSVTLRLAPQTILEARKTLCPSRLGGGTRLVYALIYVAVDYPQQINCRR